MNELWQKIKGTWTGSLFFGAFLLGIFIILFYLANLDLKGTPEKKLLGEIPAELSKNDEAKKRLKSSEFSFLDFESWAEKNNLPKGVERYDGDVDKDGLSNFLEYVHGTDPRLLDTDGDKFTDKQEIVNGYDPGASGDRRPDVEISIEKIAVHAPMVWSKNSKEADMLSDLENGVAHFSGAASPGQIGNAVISGHSSNYVWKVGKYNHIFKNLNDLKIGDVIVAKVIQNNGRVITYRYAVKDKFITGADDEEIFAKTENETLTLSTCWPLGTTLRRLIVKAEMMN